MLSLTLSPGEYVTIGDNVILQFDCAVGERCKLAFQAPRDVAILRGEVRERGGAQRPDCVFDEARPRGSAREKRAGGARLSGRPMSAPAHWISSGPANRLKYIFRACGARPKATAGHRGILTAG